jgi:hypothetical protein
MAAPSFGSIDLNVGLSSKDLRDLENAASDIESGLTSFVKSATKVGFDKKTIRSIEKMGDNVAESFKTGMASASRIQDQMAKASESHAKQIKKMKEGAAKQDEIASHKAMMSGLKSEWHGIQKRLGAEEAALQDRIQKQDHAIERQGKYMEKSWRNAAGEAGQEAADEFGSALTSGSVDLKGLGKKLAGGLSGAAGKAGAGAKQAAGGMEAGKMASALGGIGSALGALAAVIGPLTAIIGVLFAADAQAKAFNKTILESAGVADLAYGSGTIGGVRELEARLNDLQQAAVNVSGATRESTKDILASLAAANAAGLQYAEMTKFVEGASTSLEAYQSFASVAVNQARMLGVSVNVISEQMATWSEDLGGSLDDMQKSFTKITQAAMQSGFGTKRLFTAVSQATSGTALYNSALDETIALMGQLSKSLGKSGASEFVKALQKGFAGEGYQDRFKRLMIAGKGDMSEIFENEANTTIKTFSSKFGTALQGVTFEGAALKVGAELQDAMGSGDMTMAIDKMAKMSEQELRSLVTQTENQGNPEMAQQLQTMIRLSKGTQGSLSEQAKGLDALGAGGVLASKITSGLGGRAISEMSALELAAFESYAGISGEQLVELRRVDSQLRGQYERMGEIAAAAKASAVADGEDTVTYSPDQVEELQKLGAIMQRDPETDKIIGVMADEQGNLLDANGKRLDSVSDYIQGQGAALESALDVPQSATQAISEGIQRNTIGMQQVLENTIVGLLQSLNFINRGIWDATLGLDGQVRELKEKTVAALETEIAELDAGLTEKKSEAAQLETKIAQTQGGEEKEKLEAELAALNAGIVGLTQVRGEKQGEMRGVQEKSAQGLGWMDSAKLATAGAGEVATESILAPIFDVGSRGLAKGMHAATGMGNDDETIDRLADQLVQDTKDWVDSAATVGGVIGAEDHVSKRVSGTTLEDEVLAATLAATKVAEDKAAEDAKAEKKAEKDRRDLEKEVENSPEAIAKAMAERELREKLMALDVAPGKALEKAVKAIQEGKMGTGATGLSEEVTAGLKGSFLGSGGGGGGGGGGQYDFDMSGNPSPNGGFDSNGKPPTSEGDFIWRAGKGAVGISSRDDILGAKPGGPVDKGGGGGGGAGNNVSVNIYGGDTKKLYATLKEWGVV